MFSHGVMSGKKASSDRGLCAIKGQLSVPCSRKDPKPIFEPLSEYYKDHATLPNAGYPSTGYSDHRPAGTAQVLVTSE